MMEDSFSKPEDSDLLPVRAHGEISEILESWWNVCSKLYRTCAYAKEW